MSASRWDGFQTATQQSTLNRQFDTQTNFIAAPDGLVRSGLISQQVNTIDPSFYDCIYGISNTANTIIERCYKEIGCCSDGCCKNSSWHNKYGWAVALIVIFCILVIIAFVTWLAFWLINRQRDKQQRKEITEQYYEENTYSGLPTPQPTPTHFPSNQPHYPPHEQYSYDPARDRDNYRY